MAKPVKRMADTLDLRTRELMLAVATLDKLTANPFWSPQLSGPVHAAARAVVAAFEQSLVEASVQVDKGKKTR